MDNLQFDLGKKGWEITTLLIFLCTLSKDCDAGKNTCSELELNPRINLKFYVNAK